MKKRFLLLAVLLSFCLFFTQNIDAKQETNTTENKELVHGGQVEKRSNFVRTLSIGAIVFGSLSMIGGIYIMFYDPKKKKKGKSKAKKKQDK